MHQQINTLTELLVLYRLGKSLLIPEFAGANLSNEVSLRRCRCQL